MHCAIESEKKPKNEVHNRWGIGDKQPRMLLTLLYRFQNTTSEDEDMDGRTDLTQQRDVHGGAVLASL